MMNLIKVEDDDGATTYLNKDNIVRVYRDTHVVLNFMEFNEDVIVAVKNTADFKCVCFDYDEGLWNNFLLSEGWIQSKDDKSIVNGRWVDSVKKRDGVYMAYVTEKYYVSNGYIGSHYIGIEITEREFSKLKRKEIE